MNLVIDGGNTRYKVGVFSDTLLDQKHFFSSEKKLKSFVKHHQFDCAIVSSVNRQSKEILRWVSAEKKFILSYSLPMPIIIQYKTPKTLGVDRLAAVCGATDIFPEKDCLVIDAGTCITYDFVDRYSNYYGGAISPGLAMRFDSLHTFTKRLPLVSASGNYELIGNSTESCIRSGVLNGMCVEIEGIIEKYRLLHPEMRVILCGGDSLFFENKLKPTIFAAPDLVLSGLNRILLYNAAL